MTTRTLLLSIAFALARFTPDAGAQEAERLNPGQARAALSVKPPRNPVKSSSPIVKRSYERRPSKGLDVEVGPAAAGAGGSGPSPTAPAGEVDVEVVHREDGSTEVRPYVPLPILFVVGEDTLLDATSRANVDEMARILKDLGEKERAIFQIQGHTSAEGTTAANQALSEKRAARIRALLAAKQVDPGILDSIGLGEDSAQFSENAPDSQRQLDRRVLIVRMK